MLSFRELSLDYLAREVAIGKRASSLNRLWPALGQTPWVFSDVRYIECKVVDDAVVHLSFIRLLFLRVFTRRRVFLVTLALGTTCNFFLLCLILRRFYDKTVIVNVDIRCCVDVENRAIRVIVSCPISGL